MKQNFDIIIAGFGCAGMSLIYHLMESSLRDKSILIIEPDNKTANDRTWCYWSISPHPIHPNAGQVHYWEKIKFLKNEQTISSNIAPLKYYHLKSSDFYKHIKSKVSNLSNITIIQDKIIGHSEKGNRNVEVETVNYGKFSAEWLFSSIPDTYTALDCIKQEFLGWTIETTTPVFDPSEATWMDFGAKNSDHSGFFYVLPFSPTSALIEYTVFSKQKQDLESMKPIMAEYIRRQIGNTVYQIKEKESGSIPMTTKKFSKNHSGKIVYLGTAAGCSKPSTGYTFMDIQKHSTQIIKALEKNQSANAMYWKRPLRFGFYDNILLNIIAKWPTRFHEVCVGLFEKNRGRDVLRFLHEETHIGQELALLMNLKFALFIKSLLRYESH